jgi:hypothetical protein
MSKQGNNITVTVDNTNFDPLNVLKRYSTKFDRLPECIELIQDHFDRNDQAQEGYTSHNVFVSKTELGTFVFAVIDYRESNITKAITKNTLFTVELTIKSRVDTKAETGRKIEWQKYELAGAFENVPLLDVVKCQFKDESLASVGILCIPIEPCWDISYHNPFQKLDQEFKVGVAIRSRCEPVENKGLHRNTDGDRRTESQQTETKKDLSLPLRKWHFHRTQNNENYLLMCIAHGDSNPYPLTSATPIKVKLILRSIARYSSRLVHPYRTSISIEPWYVKKENGYVHGLLAVPLRVSTEKEIQFFEAVSKSPESLRLEITTLEQKY